MPSERLAMLAQIAQKQEQIMQLGGMSNPLAGVTQNIATPWPGCWRR